MMQLWYFILLKIKFDISISNLFTFAYSDVTKFLEIWSESSSNIFSNPRLKFTLSSDFGLPLPRYAITLVQFWTSCRFLTADGPF